MKQLIALTSLLFLASCVSTSMNREIADGSWDALSDESFMRWGQKRLAEDKSVKADLVGCYQGKVNETLTQLKKDFITKGQNPDYWLNVGTCYFIQENWSKAEFYFRMTLDEAKTPTLKSIALNNLGLIHFKYEQWEVGKDYLKQATALTPKFKIPRYNLSQLYLQFGFYDKAIEILTDSQFRGQKDIDIYFSLANAYLYKGDLKQSEYYFKQIPEAHFEREDIAATYALYLMKTGKIAEASRVMKDRSRSGVPEITVVSQKIEKMLAQRMKKD